MIEWSQKSRPQKIPRASSKTPTGAANIGGLNFSCLFQRAEIQMPVNKYECPQRLSFSLGNLFWDSFTNHNTGNYLRHGINITTNQRLSPTFRGNGNTIIVGDSQSHVSSPDFSWGRGTSVHTVENFKPVRNPVLYRKPRFCKRRVWMQVKVQNTRELKRYVAQNISSNSWYSTDGK